MAAKYVRLFHSFDEYHYAYLNLTDVRMLAARMPNSIKPSKITELMLNARIKNLQLV